MRHLVLASFLAALTPITSSPQAACLSYAARTFVTGTLKREVFPGPPNYTSIARGDAPEIYYVLQFQPPICIDRDPANVEKPAISSLRQMQLMLTKADYVQLETWLGKSIRLSGFLVEAHTGHHHTPVLLNDVKFGQ